MNYINFDLFRFLRKVVYLSLFELDKLMNKRQKIIILSYHGISSENWDFNVTLTEFKKQIKYLKQNFKFITLNDLQDYLEGNKDFKDSVVLITFDDGYNDLIKIKDFLISQNIKPTLFLLSNEKMVNRQQINNSKKFLDKSNVSDLKKAGWEIGSHSATHPDFWKLSDTQIINEVAESKTALQKNYGQKIYYFAYPRGRYDSNIINQIKKAGYKLALTMDDGVIDKSSNPYLLPRIGINKTHDLAEFRASFSPSVVFIRGFLKKTVRNVL